MFDHAITMRLDKNTYDLLNELKKQLSLASKADVVRKSLKLWDTLLNIENKNNEIIIRSRKTLQEERLVLIDI